MRNLLNSIVTAFHMFQKTHMVLILEKKNVCSKHNRITFDVLLAKKKNKISSTASRNIYSAEEIMNSLRYFLLSLFLHIIKWETAISI